MFLYRICSTCQIEKEHKDFPKHKHGRDGIAASCKKCASERTKKYREDKKDKYKEYNKNYYLKNKKEIKEKQKEYRNKNKNKIKKINKNYTNKVKLENPEKLKYYTRKYKSKNKEKIKQYNKKYSKENRGIINAKEAKRRSIKLNATPNWAEIDKIKLVYKKAKWLERITGLKYHVDHIIPLNNPNVCGLHVWANLQILEVNINCSKGNSFE